MSPASPPPPSLSIQPAEPSDLSWARVILSSAWGSTRVITRGHVHAADALPQLVARESGSPVGLLVWRMDGPRIEIVSLNVLSRRRGVGRALVEACLAEAARRRVGLVWLVTTNDNLPAQAFFEAVGFSRVAVHAGAVDAARRIKHEIPRIGVGGRPIHDEIEYARQLAPPAPPSPPSPPPE